MKARLYSQLTLALLVFLSLSACRKSTEQRIQEKEEALRQLHETRGADAITREKQLFGELSQLYESLASEQPGSAAAQEALVKASTMYISLEQYDKAVEILDKAMSQNGESDPTAVALFQKAFVLNNYLKDLPKAEAVYREFIQRFPEHPLRADAENELEFLGLSPEEILRRRSGDGVDPEAGVNAPQ